MRKTKRPSRPKPTLQSMAMEHAVAAFQAIVQIAENSLDDSVRLKASQAIVDRAYGRPPQLDPKDFVKKEDRLAAIIAHAMDAGSRLQVSYKGRRKPRPIIDDDIDEDVEP
ncbi:hypothetical protein EF888_05935 [Silicimonas algicola]|uniref:hypothetical protein n=1 Tax=Silicimonas algicola TaxID=1826607 RepID=UPI000D6AF488|nr:hypothetical protein [Silicimonas algicola]AZQ66720.1 hypothetical protein EF888_05935 [Silicimonas algicola]